MVVNIKSLQAKLLNVAKEQEIEFQLLLNRFALEQFLARLSQSRVAKKFILKGGSLLSYLIATDRKTKDLDFAIKQLSNHIDDLLRVIQSIVDVRIDDGITWGKLEGSILNHPAMDYPGARIICRFNLGQMRGYVRIDLAFGDFVEATKIVLRKIRYKGQPLIGDDFSLLAYPPETIFSEKLQIALARGAGNTRMKDYYDLFKLSNTALNPKTLRRSIQATFSNRKMDINHQIPFDPSVIERLQTYWSRYRAKEKLEDAPENISDIIERLNVLLKQIFLNE